MNQNVKHSPQRLHEFLRQEQEAILEDWRALGKRRINASRDLSDELQRNRVPELLESIAASAEKVSTSTYPAKLPGKWPKHHAEQRWELGFTLEETTREYGLLRMAIFKRLIPQIETMPTEEVGFLNEALDEAIVEAVNNYVAKANRRLASERERLDVTLQSIGDGVVSTGPDGIINYINPAAQSILSCSLEEALGQPVNSVMVTLDETTRERLKCAALCATENGQITHRGPDILLQRADGKLIPAEETAAPLRDARGEFIGAVTTFRDISKERSLRQRLGYLSAYDALTGLPNRALFVDRLYKTLVKAEHDELGVAVLHLDLDQFKDANDTLGRSGGDNLLKKVGKRLASCIDRSDTVSHVGSDEFILFLSDVEHKDYVSGLCDKLQERIGHPFKIRGQDVHISVSIGISTYPDDGLDPNALLKHAETATKQAKAEGRNIGKFFTAQLNQQAEERRHLRAELKKAVAADQLALYFQPQICLSSGKAEGAEALLRWEHPELGQVSPGRFIPVAEQHGELMLEIGDWVLKEACRQARAWDDAGHAPLRISVNVSLVQLRHDTLVSRIEELLSLYQLRPAQLQLELTESLLMTDIAGATDRVRALKALGVGVSVDDFGTGYSSLSYLQELPVDELKIDQSFLRGITSNQEKAAIVKAIISLGESLPLRILAEGVEDRHTADFLRGIGCESAQGFLYSKAIAPELFEAQYLASQ
ncbi:EAL domain-containing protein [Marinobacter sp. ATCH36]|uniref:EAL domain-containing protein n=1 Tax=Marinobacter sp. ATCH36 TaxID=2945106 RepID=UPI00201FC5D7|nr:EAL domain-containing protein [Marinobacter sp. ATCH36]MCL7944703.1 EAL domain-containing protein [Marinobacter sp. ATCH36]